MMWVEKSEGKCCWVAGVVESTPVNSRRRIIFFYTFKSSGGGYGTYANTTVFLSGRAKGLPAIRQVCRRKVHFEDINHPEFLDILEGGHEVGAIIN